MVGGLGGLDFHISLLSDIRKSISGDYGVLNDNGISMRGTFIIDTKGILRYASVGDIQVGRNVDETLRYIQAVT